MTDEPRFYTVDDYEDAARRALPSDFYDYVAGAAGDEWTLAANRRAFDRWVLRPRFLRGTDTADTSTEVLGERIDLPVLIAPWGYQRLAHPEGEVATARAAGRAGTVFCVPSSAVDILEEVAGAADGPKWWQLYVATDRSFTEDLLARVCAAGYRALVWTVDLPTYGLRHRDERNAFEIPAWTKPEAYVYDCAITWDDLPWIRRHAPGLPLLVKGILTREDADLAVTAGVDGIVVSNHGGRQLDTCLAAFDSLVEVLEAVGGRVPVLMDGGVRRGTDAVKALALGAAAVMVARPTAWGLAAGGEDGVVDVLRILRDEVENTMAMCGCRTVADITRDHVAPAPGW
jgi:4-hydroxymandelate oxidase